ncbi:ATP-dependent DNA helicase RecQ [Bacteroidia bacterium]|nr:ATP-dependent DNA helicase RecQ [Bacteroidia bacterium]GHV42842.1 ATP-dependent DNA helicase RecQ [Bacteroidia bacterium]
MEFTTDILQQKLKQLFGFDRFKFTQEKAITSILEGKNVFVIMPTGGGKSLCYQLPAMLMDGVAIIVSPLIALMKNQVEAVRSFGTEIGIAHYLNSSLAKYEITAIKKSIANGTTKMLYVAPESLAKQENIDYFKTVPISFYAIDEAHCISEWGHDFRPEYRKLHKVFEEIGQNVPIVALTATATEKVRQDIIENLHIQDANISVDTFCRPNLFYEVRQRTKHIDRDIVNYIRDNPDKSGIVYCLSRNKTEKFAEVLKVNGISSLPYHAGISKEQRAKNQDAFQSGKVQVIVATVAFGMGIDKPDVRFVIHYNLPKSVEAYYQETGRAGRDGGEGRCIAYYSDEDINKIEALARRDRELPEAEKASQLIADTISYAYTGMCRRKYLLNYFGEEYPKHNCGNCDNCVTPREMLDVDVEAQFVAEMMSELNASVKDKAIVNILTGNLTAPVKKGNFHETDFFGCGSDKDEGFWKSLVRQMQIENLLVRDIENYGTLKISDKGRDFVHHSYNIQIALDRQYEPEDADEATIEGTATTDPILFEMLKKELKLIAKKHGVKDWTILNEQSLADMSIFYPMNMEEMSQVHGMGEAKASKYGQDFINLISKYVLENDIDRPHKSIVRELTNKSALRIYIIRNIDKCVSLDDIARSKGLAMNELIDEMEQIVASGTKININYYVDNVLDEDRVEEISDYFADADNPDIDLALAQLGENDFNSDEIRLVRLKVLTECGF